MFANYCSTCSDYWQGNCSRMTSIQTYSWSMLACFPSLLEAWQCIHLWGIQVKLENPCSKWQHHLHCLLHRPNTWSWNWVVGCIQASGLKWNVTWRWKSDWMAPWLGAFLNLTKTRITIYGSMGVKIYIATLTPLLWIEWVFVEEVFALPIE